MSGVRRSGTTEWPAGIWLACYTHHEDLGCGLEAATAPFDIEKDVSWDTGTDFKGSLPDSEQVPKNVRRVAGGTFQRILQSTYQRVSFSHMARCAKRWVCCW